MRWYSIYLTVFVPYLVLAQADNVNEKSNIEATRITDNLHKRVSLDEIFIFRDSVMPEYQLIEENENIAERNFFDFASFRSDLNINDQFVLFDVSFTYSKKNADESQPSKSHYYVTHDMLAPGIPTDWTSPIDYRNGSVHIRLEVIEKPSKAPTTWSLCYIPNTGQGNGYGCTSTGIYMEEGLYESDISMTSFWENESIIWSEGIKQMDLVIKDDSGGKGHAHNRSDPENYFPTTVRITMVQVAEGAAYNPEILDLNSKN